MWEELHQEIELDIKIKLNEMKNSMMVLGGGCSIEHIVLTHLSMQPQ
jgi:arginase family enzyme